MLTASILVAPLAVIPLMVHTTHWSWLMLLCVPVAYGLATLRHRFEFDEWLARDLARASATPTSSREAAETVDGTINAGS